jgi:3-oxoacyl-[acyl-carrier protein] reductase
MKVLLTGAKSDISKSLKSYLTSKDHEVITTSHNLEPDSIPFDLMNPENSLAEIESQIKMGLDVLILNAATPTYRLASFDKIEWNELNLFLNSNIQGNIWLLQKILPHFLKQKFGRIVFISSQTTQTPLRGYSIYSAAKSALETTMKYIATEYGEFNITANTLRLGIIETERNKKFTRRSSIHEKMIQPISLKRLGKPADLHLSIDALIDKNCYIQGATIDISGGISTPS